MCVCVCVASRDMDDGGEKNNVLEQNTIVLFSSVQDVSQRKAYTVPLPMMIIKLHVVNKGT